MGEIDVSGYGEYKKLVNEDNSDMEDLFEESSSLPYWQREKESMIEELTEIEDASDISLFKGLCFSRGGLLKGF